MATNHHHTGGGWDGGGWWAALYDFAAEAARLAFAVVFGMALACFGMSLWGGPDE